MNDLATCGVVLLAAFALDGLLGDPCYSLHPVRLIGRAIALLEKPFRFLRCSGVIGGGLFNVTVLGLVAAVYWGIRNLLGLGHAGLALAWDIYAVYSCVALRDLVKHARPVAEALDGNNLSGARSAVQKMVGRDTAVLDAQGVARAAVESVAEGFLDGVFSPLCAFLVGALCAFAVHQPPLPWAVAAILLYKAANTLDSMVGYRNEQYLYFGRASARLDDMLNFVPARLSLAVLFVASVLCRLNSRAGWKTALRDRLKHESPNSAHTESFAAGALGLRLGGPLQYPDGHVEKPWLGDGSPDATAGDIRAVCRLILCSGWFSVVVSSVLLLILGGMVDVRT